ncbi:porin family protein [Winogradskyella aurantia]|uniref:Outer membrane protein beta-barrel domain-containing protein n=1 Tax=Winogradskyella aurantia TaxID=1915063 RepID=A0A265UX75_9FLAO|nr:hypothetical protein [Winogradskyella aurantia]OZV69918.1 hypothetical protein CA834_04675 [Winogradskyella aurantia]
MKNVLFAFVFSLYTVSISAQSQVDFGVKGGVNLTFFDVIEGDFGPNAQVDVGYYGGVFADFKMEDGFHIQPEVLYIGISDFRFLNVPIYLKYDIKYNFHILVGPSLNYFFDFFTNKFKVRADITLAYDLSDRLDLHMKYTLGFEELSPDVIFLGLSYRL